MNRHRVLLLVSAVGLIAFGIFQVVFTHTHRRSELLGEQKKLAVQYMIEGRGYDRDYIRLLNEALAISEHRLSLTLAHYTVVGGLSFVMGMLILAVLADTRGRKPRADSSGKG